MKLIFIPGAGGTSSAWYYQTKFFIDSVAIDLPGHPEGDPCGSIEDYTDWLSQYIFSRNYTNLVLVGHSMGGAIAQVFALDYPADVKGLVLIGTGTRLRVNPQFLGLVETGIDDPPMWIKDFVEPRYSLVAPCLKDNVIKEVVEMGARVQLSDFRCCDQFDVMDKIYQVRIPTLVICGSEDQMTPVKYSKYLVDRIKDARLEIIDGGTHYVFMEKPDEVNEVIEEFVTGL